MSVVFLNHARVPMAEVMRHHDQRGAGHDRQAGPRMPQPVKRECLIELGGFRGISERAEVMVATPPSAVGSRKQREPQCTTSHELAAEIRAFSIENDVARLTALAVADKQGAALNLKIPNIERA